MRKKISKVWGKIRKLVQNLRKKWGKWNSCPRSCPPRTVRLATALELSVPIIGTEIAPLTLQLRILYTLLSGFFFFFFQTYYDSSMKVTYLVYSSSLVYAILHTLIHTLCLSKYATLPITLTADARSLQNLSPWNSKSVWIMPTVLTCAVITLCEH